MSAVKRTAGTSLDYASCQGNRKHNIQPLSTVLRKRQQKFRPLSAAKRTARTRFNYCHLSGEQTDSKLFDHCQLSKKQAAHDSNTADKLYTVKPVPADVSTTVSCQENKQHTIGPVSCQRKKQHTFRPSVLTAVSCRGKDQHTIGPASCQRNKQHKFRRLSAVEGMTSTLLDRCQLSV